MNYTSHTTQIYNSLKKYSQWGNKRKLWWAKYQ